MKNVFTIGPQAAFLDTLAAELWRRAEGDGFRLAEMLILLPTRRACRSLGAAFAKLAAGKPVLLPRMRPLGDVDEDEITFADEGDFDLPPAMPPMRRTLMLARLVMARDAHMSCDQAVAAADALGKFLDQTQIEQCDTARLSGLVAERELAEHWQQTLAFLDLVLKNWPGILAEQGCVDAAERRNMVLAAQADLWRRQPPSHPVIAAGSTGSVKATAALLDVIAQLPQGAVVLPGLNRAIDDKTWDKIGDTHPQHAMKNLLATMGVARDQVRDFGAVTEGGARATLLTEATRPAEATEAWKELHGKLTPDCTLGLSRLTLDTPQEEAQVIALRLREVLEHEGKTAALVTGDRGLAQRVAALLRRWDVEADDSGGAPLAEAAPGVFLNLVLAAASPDGGAVDRLALLKHPFAACGRFPAVCRAAARETELTLRRTQTEDFSSLLERLAPLTQSWNEKLPLPARIELHIRAAESVAQSDRESGPERLWRGDIGAAVTEWIDELRDGGGDFPPLSGRAYADLFTSLARTKSVRLQRATHPRLSILGPLEARLLNADLIILGGMNEGVWPPDPGFDPWMSRPMRRDYGLPSPEFRIGLAAHDFAQLTARQDVMITRAARSGGTPTTPSRFLLQIEAVLRAAGLLTDKYDPLEPTVPWRAWARGLDHPGIPQTCARPRPCPPVETRPTSLSVTEITTWMRNPYAIYARHILKLKKLDDLDAPLDAADRGDMIHAALEAFLRTYPKDMPDDALTVLLALGREIFARGDSDPRVQAFWWARFCDIAAWFIPHEAKRRAEGIYPLAAECKASIPFGGFTLTGRADRIDRTQDNRLVVVDYKTGSAPTVKQVQSGIEPQLQLLAMMAEGGAFKDVPPAPSASLEYWLLKGGRSESKISDIKKDIDKLTAEAAVGLQNLIAAFAKPDTPYEAVPVARLAPKFNDYEHLARLKEWSQGGDDE